MPTVFKIINRHREISVIYQTDDFIFILHEYLSIINDKLTFLINHNLQLSINKLNFDHLYILRCIDDGSKYFPICTKEKIYFDFKSKKLVNAITDSSIINNLISNICNNLNLLNSGSKNTHEPIFIQKPTFNPNRVIENLTESIDFSDPDKLKNKIDELEKLKNEKLNKLEDNKKIHTKDVKDFTKFSTNLFNKKRDLNEIKDELQQKHNVYKSDKKAYQMMKLDIEAGDLEEKFISPFFVKKYPIFKFMDQHNLFDQHDEFNVYNDLDDTLNEKDNEQSYLQKNIPQNIIDEFIEEYGQKYNDDDISSEIDDESDNDEESVSSDEEIILQLRPQEKKDDWNKPSIITPGKLGDDLINQPTIIPLVQINDNVIEEQNDDDDDEIDVSSDSDEMYFVQPLDNDAIGAMR